MRLGERAACARDGSAAAATASATPIQKKTQRPGRPLRRHDDEAERRVQDPGGELSEEADLEVVAARDDDLYPSTSTIPREHDEHAGERQPASSQSSTTATTIDSRSASGSATFRTPTRRATAARGSRRAGRSGRRRRRRSLPPRPRRLRRRETARTKTGIAAEAENRQCVRDVATHLDPAHGRTLDGGSVAARAGDPCPTGFVNAHSHTFQRAL